MAEEKPTEKEIELAKKLIQARLQRGGFQCKPQTCSSITSPCAIYCPDMTCGTMGPKADTKVECAAFPNAYSPCKSLIKSDRGIFCPTKLVCPRFTCEKVQCNLAGCDKFNK